MNNKKYIYSLFLILFIILVSSLIAGLSISNKLSNATKSDSFWANREKVESHIMVIVDDSNQTYDDAFVKGMDSVAAEYKIAVEMTRVDHSNYHTDVLDALDKAKYAKVDGIVLHAFDDEEILKKINEITALKIPVITIDGDVSKSTRICYVGVNKYDVGQMAGELLADLLSGVGKIAIIDQKGYSSNISSNDEMILLGFKEVLKGYPLLTVDVIKYTEQGVLSAETAATEVIKNNPEISGFFCTEGANTLGVAQVLIDNNLVNDMVLIGYGNETEIIEYVEKSNIVEATIITDHEDIGKKVIQAFHEYKENNFVSSFINTDLSIVDEFNVEDYINEMSENYGKVE